MDMHGIFAHMTHESDMNETNCKMICITNLTFP